MRVAATVDTDDIDDIDQKYLADKDQSDASDGLTIKVVGQALNVKIGSGGPPELSGDGTTYEAPYAAIVTDEGGNPAANGVLNLNLKSVSYRSKDQTHCPAEVDSNHNGTVDEQEDKNVNGQFDPGRVASVAGTPQLDESGVARFNITYLVSYASRITVELTATAKANGTEGTRSTSFPLPGDSASGSPFTANCAVATPD